MPSGSLRHNLHSDVLRVPKDENASKTHHQGRLRVQEGGDRGVLLTNSDVDTEQVFTLLVNDRIDSDSGFACLAVADDQFTLSTSDRNHAINSLEAGLYGSI